MQVKTYEDDVCSKTQSKYKELLIENGTQSTSVLQYTASFFIATLRTEPLTSHTSDFKTSG